MSNVTIIIVVADYHRELLDRAVASANAQTVSCEVFVYEDTEMRGAGYARNKALAEVETEFVVFLDADDEISPTFVERCLSVWQPNHYVYTGWLVDGVHNPAPYKPWVLGDPNINDGGEWHVLTTLLPTSAVRAVGGFEEHLKAAEDTYLYWALTRNNICGIRLDEPLFTYGKEGQRSKALYTQQMGTRIVTSEYYREIIPALWERYKNMSCCGGDNPIQAFVPDQPNDIQAMAMWGGNRRVLGVITGRLYPRSSYPHVVSVDPRDVDARPDEWQRVRPPAPAPVVAPQSRIATFPQVHPSLAHDNRVFDGVGELVQAVFPNAKAAQEAEAVLTASELKATLPDTVKPDVSKVRRLAKGKK